MSTALNIDHFSTLISNAADEARCISRPTLPRFTEISVIQDHQHSIDWVQLGAGPSICFSRNTLSELLMYLGSPGANPQTRVLTSIRKGIFSLGGDLQLFRQCISTGSREELCRYGEDAVSAIWHSVSGGESPEVITISIANGEAQGGGFEAALACHVFIAERGARFGFPEGLFGLFPGMGAEILLSARVGPAMAKRIIGSARQYSAEELFGLGVVDFLAEPGMGREAAVAMTRARSCSGLTDLRIRFQAIKRDALVDTVHRWVDQALGLSAKHLAVIDYILAAQRKLVTSKPTVRLLAS